MQRRWRMLLTAVLLIWFVAPSAWAGVKVKLQLFVDGLIHPMEKCHGAGWDEAPLHRGAVRYDRAAAA